MNGTTPAVSDAAVASSSESASAARPVKIAARAAPSASGHRDRLTAAGWRSPSVARRALFEAALDVAPATREDWLREAARDEPSLADEVRALLEADAVPGPLLDEGALPRPVPAAARRGTDTGAGAPPARVGPWRVGVVVVVGQGGMGTVFRATDDGGRVVALKRLDAPLDDVAAAARFAREVRLGARVTHPHLLPVLDALHAESRAWLTMPLVDGETLRARLDREGRLPVVEAVRLATALARHPGGDARRGRGAS